MARQLVSNHKAYILSFLLFLGCLAVLIISKKWWPGILLVVGLPIALKQLLIGKRFDMTISLIVFIGGFITVQFDIAWQIILPVIFILGALYIILREFFAPKETTESEKEKDLNEEIKEDKKNNQ